MTVPRVIFRVQTARRTTLAETVYTRLRDDILACRFKPREKLLLARLKLQYGAGVSPIREALSQLAADGLVRLESQRGAFVADVSEDDLRDLLRLRENIEDIALRWSIQNGDGEWETAAVASFHRFSLALKSESKDLASDHETQRLHDEFHAALWAACRSPRLIEWLGTIYDQTKRYRLLADYGRPWDASVLNEHDVILNAVLARDADLACALFRSHVRRTVDLASSNIRRFVVNEKPK